MIETSEYKVEKVFHSIITSSIPDKYMLPSTSHFIEKMKKLEVQSHQVLVSFDTV